MQIRRARSFGLAQLCAYFKNGGHQLSTDLPVEMCVRLKRYYTLDTTTQNMSTVTTLTVLPRLSHKKRHSWH